jgi:hypothetical protein
MGDPTDPLISANRASYPVLSGSQGYTRVLSNRGKVKSR